jgi:hypothetical protein
MTKPKGKASKQYRDTVFRTLFHDKKRAIELCNAVVGTAYPDDTPVELCSLDPSSLLARYNDVAFAIGNQLIVMCEHQSSINPNMPLRFLPYITDTIYSRFSVSDRIYSSSLVKIPTPKFYVLYNGAEELRETVLRLSDAFVTVDDSPALELMITVIDINRDSGNEVLRKSPSLDGYAHLISEIEKRVKNGMHRDKAIKEAVTFCIEQGILAEFLRENYEEVCKMLGYEYNAEAEARVLKDEGIQEGMADVAKKLLGIGDSVDKVVTVTGLPRDEVERLRN